MNYDLRNEYYRKLEVLRGHPLIVYVTSTREGAAAVMASDALSVLIDHIESLPENCEEIDLLIESNGGDGLVALRAIQLLRSKVKKVHIIIPYVAFSAATLLALGGDSILMGKYGCLGPIDPQITVKKADGTQDLFAYEDVVAFFDFTKEIVGLTKQEYKQDAFKMMCEKASPLTLGFAKRSSSLSVDMGQQLLLTHMLDNESSQAKTKEIATRLNKSFFNHGHALYRKEAKNIGLEIVTPSIEEEKLMWQIHKSFEQEMNSREQFNPLSEFLADPSGSTFLEIPPNINIPPQLGTQVLQQMLMTYLQQQLNKPTPNVEKNLVLASIESVRMSSQFTMKVKILVTRSIDLKFSVNCSPLKSGWTTQAATIVQGENNSITE